MLLSLGSSALPNPNLGQVRQIQSEGYLKGNALELTFRGKPSKYFSGQIQYTLSRTDNNTSGITLLPRQQLQSRRRLGTLRQ